MWIIAAQHTLVGALRHNITSSTMLSKIFMRPHTKWVGSSLWYGIDWWLVWRRVAVILQSWCVFCVRKHTRVWTTCLFVVSSSSITGALCALFTSFFCVACLNLFLTTNLFRCVSVSWVFCERSTIYLFDPSGDYKTAKLYEETISILKPFSLWSSSIDFLLSNCNVWHNYTTLIHYKICINKNICVYPTNHARAINQFITDMALLVRRAAFYARLHSRALQRPK